MKKMHTYTFIFCVRNVYNTIIYRGAKSFQVEIVIPTAGNLAETTINHVLTTNVYARYKYTCKRTV